VAIASGRNKKRTPARARAPRNPACAFGLRDAACGFTLVEVLVTIFVICIALALVSLAIGHDSGAQLRQETERLRGAL